ncbi:type I phosphomannose isomerase catalytic subunit [Lutibacter flavus]|uniref:Phosphohexomutase n=1 Tax=Lutibacter flavus TaxID=691689 RepID=A0A238VXF8_9FLAO|nr:type I phosphomannose isomerase catalytic subunit [Lutibacter flavus]SNR38139.1 mannose-6-phosphate isomerase, type 1 [Lutibacter flavus]
MNLYPLKFEPLYKYRIWGGEKLKTVLNKNYNDQNIGESWEISDVKGDETKVINGDLEGFTLKQLIQKFKGDFVGKHVYETYGDEFPLLIKFIDAKTPLSIQVHPSDELAKERHDSFGKNEMWYIMQSDEGAELIAGFKGKVSKETYKKHLKNSTITSILNVEKVKEGDTFYIPTGRVHAIGSGVLLAEIQQTSDITYRIYDYDRVDSKTGEQRELHNDLAIDVIDYKVHDNYKTEYLKEKNVSNTLVHSPYFKTNIIFLAGEIEKDYSKLDSFVIYICVDGEFDLECENTIYSLKKGETILIPASIDTIRLKGDSAKILEVSL